MASSTTNMPSEALKFFIPTPYDGTDPVDASRFIAQCIIWFKKAKITNTNDKIGEALALLKGRAMTWGTPHLVTWSKDEDPFETWDKFVEAFKAHFGNVDDEDKALGELGRFCRRGRNNRTVAEFAVEFESLSMRTALSPTDLHTRFTEGLPDRIRKAIAVSGRGHDSLSELNERRFKSTKTSSNWMKMSSVDFSNVKSVKVKQESPPPPHLPSLAIVFVVANLATGNLNAQREKERVEQGWLPRTLLRRPLRQIHQQK